MLASLKRTSLWQAANALLKDCDRRRSTKSNRIGATEHSCECRQRAKVDRTNLIPSLMARKQTLEASRAKVDVVCQMLTLGKAIDTWVARLIAQAEPTVYGSFGRFPLWACSCNVWGNLACGFFILTWESQGSLKAIFLLTFENAISVRVTLVRVRTERDRQSSLLVKLAHRRGIVL